MNLQRDADARFWDLRADGRHSASESSRLGANHSYAGQRGGLLPTEIASVT